MSKQILIRVKTVTAREEDEIPPVLDSIRRTWWPDEK